MAGDVEVVGVGMVPFGRFKDVSLEGLGVRAVLKALTDAGVSREQVDEVFCGSSFSGSLIGQRVMRNIGLTGLPITNVENACSSGATALREGVSAIVSGRARTVLVVGLDKLSHFGGGTIPLVRDDFEAGQGMVMPALYAMRAQHYMAATGARPEHFAAVAVKAHQNAQHNEYAQMRQTVTVEEVLGSRMIANPLTLLMCCPTGDGAAAAVLRATKTGSSAARITIEASVLQSGKGHTGYRDLSWSELTQRTAAMAYESAGIGPEDLDVVELHDAFASAELMYYEALSLCARGEGPKLIDTNATAIGGRVPVNPSGGLLCRGHPVGATGMAQVCEAVWQLRGTAGARQVEGARVALTHCTGGGISAFDHGACAVNILCRHDR